MILNNFDLESYPHKELIELFDKFPGKIYPWVGNFNLCPTGASYATVTQNGIKPEGFPMGNLCRSQEEVIDQYCRVIIKLFNNADETFTLYFRQVPKVRCKDGMYSIWSRLHISDWEIIQSWDGSIVNRKEDE